jgi:hypothetical protein
MKREREQKTYRIQVSYGSHHLEPIIEELALQTIHKSVREFAAPPAKKTFLQRQAIKSFVFYGSQ